jgi:penicillin-binding protein 1C
MSGSPLKQLLKSVYPWVSAVHSFRPVFNLPRLRPTLLALIVVCVGLFISVISFYDTVIKNLPSPSSLSTTPVALTTHIRDRNGLELYKIFRNQNRTLIRLGDLPPYISQAILAIEDKDFYSHRGFSLQAISRAFVSNLKCAVRIEKCAVSLQGGSTITQQLVKTSLLSPERTLTRKLRELVLALAVEVMYSKDQILEMYLNRVGFGGAAYGIEEAAQTYFGKPASSLSLAEAALLAGIPASPTIYSPFGSHPELAKERQKEVLRQMVSAGFITWEQAQATAAADLVFRAPSTDIKAPHFVMYVKDLLAKKYGHDMVEQGGLDVTTSLDFDIEQEAETVVAEEIAKISRLHITNGAALITKPATGEILAMVGSQNYFDLLHDGNFNVTTGSRQPGSSIKPVNYALAFQKGFTPATFIDDSPVTYNIPGQPPYSPVNYDNRYHGRVSLRTALASSYNVPAVKLLSANGVANMVSLGQKLGLTTWDNPERFGLSLTLGGGEVRMVDMATAYGVFADGGYRVDLEPILEVKDSKGRVLEKKLPSPQPVLDPKIAFLISDILSDNQARTPTFGSRSLLYIPGSTVAVKTGTTNNLRDNWTLGYTPDFLVAVWVGNNDNSPMSYVASGITGASPIWRRLTDFLLLQFPSPGFTPPSDLLKIAICPATGQLACASCFGKTEYFLPGTQPESACSDESLNPTPYIAPSSSRDQVEPTPFVISVPGSVRGKILDGAWTVR